MYSTLKKNIYYQLNNYPNMREHLIQIYTSLSSRGNRYKIVGKNNVICKKKCFLRNVLFDIIGDNNKIYIEKESNLNNVIFHIRGTNHNIYIGTKCTFSKGSMIWVEDNNCYLQIGDKTWIENASFALTEPNSKIEIGSNCLLAYDIDIRCGDSHSIIDIETQKRINYARDIKIHDQVWIASRTSILKGVNIGKSSIVATGSIVTKNVEANVIVAGNPARVVKTGVTWDVKRIYHQTDLEI